MEHVLRKWVYLQNPKYLHAYLFIIYFCKIHKHEDNAILSGHLFQFFAGFNIFRVFKLGYCTRVFSSGILKFHFSGRKSCNRF